jgi:hypothetical protein
MFLRSIFQVVVFFTDIDGPSIEIVVVSRASFQEGDRIATGSRSILYTDSYTM